MLRAQKLNNRTQRASAVVRGDNQTQILAGDKGALTFSDKAEPLTVMTILNTTDDNIGVSVNYQPEQIILGKTSARFSGLFRNPIIVTNLSANTIPAGAISLIGQRQETILRSVLDGSRRV